LYRTFPFTSTCKTESPPLPDPAGLRCCGGGWTGAMAPTIRRTGGTGRSPLPVFLVDEVVDDVVDPATVPLIAATVAKCLCWNFFYTPSYNMIVVKYIGKYNTLQYKVLEGHLDIG